MAWEEESVDSGLDLQETGGGKSPIKMIIIGLITILVLGGGGYLAYKFFMAEDEPAEEEAAEGEEGEEVAEEEPTEGSFLVTFDEFIINLSSGDEDPVYLKATMALEVSTEVLQSEINDENDIKLYRVKTRAATIQILRSKTPQEIRDPANMPEIQKEIQFRLNALYKSGKVKSVLFTNFTTS